MEDEDISKGLEFVRNNLERAYRDLLDEQLKDSVKELEVGSEISKELARDFMRLSKIYDDSINIIKDPLEYVTTENGEDILQRLERKRKEIEVCMLMIVNKIEVFGKYFNDNEEEE